jgi:para-nitrobenzyl esterase
MVFGESAGAINTCVLTASPLGAGLFSRALMESGGCWASPTEAAASRGVAFAEGLGCSTAGCLRGLTAEEIVRAQGGGPVNSDGTVARSFGPSVDGWVLPASPLELIRQGRHNRVPFAIGANADETALFVAPLTEAAYRATILKIFGPGIGLQVLREYPVGAYESPRKALIAVTTDAGFVCPSRTVARALDGAQNEPVYRYFFTHHPKGSAAQAAFHGLELAYVFQKFDADAAHTDLLLQRAIGEYWTNFAASGNPNGPLLAHWPDYVATVDSYVQLSAPPKPGTGVRTDKCDFWEEMRDLTAH